MSYKQLTREERYQIQAYLKIGLTNKDIARHLGPPLKHWTRNKAQQRIERLPPKASQ